VFLPEASPPADKNKLGFFITTSEAETQLEEYLSDGRVARLLGWHFHVILRSQHQLMTGSAVHVTKLTPGSGNPSRVYGQNTS
jgi:hypothetical protein